MVNSGISFRLESSISVLGIFWSTQKFLLLWLKIPQLAEQTEALFTMGIFFLEMKQFWAYSKLSGNPHYTLSSQMQVQYIDVHRNHIFILLLKTIAKQQWVQRSSSFLLFWSASFSCQFTMQWYPFDIQDCSIKLMLDFQQHHMVRLVTISRLKAKA